MSRYSANPSGNRTIRVFDIDKGVTSYTINLDPFTESIDNIIVTGNDLSVTKTNKNGNIENIIYDINKGVKKMSSIVGRIDNSESIQQSEDRVRENTSYDLSIPNYESNNTYSETGMELSNNEAVCIWGSIYLFWVYLLFFSMQ